MRFKIHRGTQEIGGSCVEVCTEHVLDTMVIISRLAIAAHLVTHSYSAHAALHDRQYLSFLPCPLGTTSDAFSCHK
jgi:hypothetical protein